MALTFIILCKKNKAWLKEKHSKHRRPASGSLLYPADLSLSYRDLPKSRYDKQLKLEIPDKAQLFGYNSAYTSGVCFFKLF